MDFIEVVLTEMGKGNFSFLILVVGILQLIVMSQLPQPTANALEIGACKSSD